MIDHTNIRDDGFETMRGSDEKNIVGFSGAIEGEGFG